MMTPMVGEDVVGILRYRVRFRPKSLSPFRRAWSWDPIAKRWKRVWVSRWRRLYWDPKASRVAVTPTPDGRSWLSATQVSRVRAVAKKRRWELQVEQRQFPRYQYVTGDMDCDLSLIARLDRVGRELRKVILIRSGRRTMAEQQQLYDTLGPAIAAFPSPNAPHVRGIAADCGIDGVNIGAYPGAREAMRKYGLCLRVPGENWHVEKGDTWNA